jgi:hypothetical protein
MAVVGWQCCISLERGDKGGQNGAKMVSIGSLYAEIPTPIHKLAEIIY